MVLDEYTFTDVMYKLLPYRDVAVTLLHMFIEGNQESPDIVAIKQ